jgi:adenylosuccinate synthase
MNHVFLTVDLGFGDAGKGSVVDFLARAYDAHTVVRYNGGAQAGHRVVTGGASPQEHVFAQFGAGTLAGAGTHLSRFMILDPLAMLAEEEHLRLIGVHDAFARTTIDARALVITPFGRAINRLRELARGAGRHGSCGVGVGETVADALACPHIALRAGDLSNRDRLYAKLCALRELNLAKLEALRPSLPDSDQAAMERDLLTDPAWADWLLDAYAEFSAQAQVVSGEHLHSILCRPGAVVFEGAQGVLLDEWRGFHPHTTWSTTTLANADKLLAEAGYEGQVSRIGITRAYATRHGAGPMPSEDAALTAALPDARNGLHAWQQGFRAGWLDLTLLRYALEVVGRLDGLAVTCLDRVANLPDLQLCRAYQVGPLQVERIIPAPSPQDLAYQERITAALANCKPVLERLGDPDDLLRAVQADLNVPILLTSHGPTAEDKMLQPSCHPTTNYCT